MKNLSPRFVSLAAVLCTSLFFSCTSDVDIPPPPVNTSSSSEKVWSYCVYTEVQQCYQGSYSTCPGGGTLSNKCPFTDEPSSSSLGGSAVASSSSESGRSSSGAVLEFNYCVFATEKMCLKGPVSSCPPGGVLSNNCSYNSSSSSLGSVGGNSSSDVQQKSSSSSSLSNAVVNSSSSESGGNSSSSIQQVYSSSSSLGGGGYSESNELGSFDATYFTDPRDGKKYKYEIAPAAGGGKIWMKENLNYSRGNTLGYCYVVNGKNLGTAGADLSGCDSPYGRIYTYSVAIDGNKPQGLCPKGWHIPSVDEWATLGAGTASAITGNRRMSSAFYVYAGNYDAAGYEGRAKGWYDRDKNGFYWANNNKNSFVVMGTNNGNYFYSKSDATDNEYYSIRCVADVGVFNFKPELVGTCNWDKNPTSTARGAKPSGVTIVDTDKICTSPTVVYKYADGTKTWPASGIFDEWKSWDKKHKETYSGVTPTLNCPAYGTTVTLPSCPPLEVRAGADYIIECTGNYANQSFCKVNGTTGNSVTLKDGECVEISVLGYTNQNDLPEVGMRCDAGSSSFKVSVNEKVSTINGNGFISLGKIKVGDNEFGTLCVTAVGGATSLKCTGPSQ